VIIIIDIIIDTRNSHFY